MRLIDEDYASRSIIDEYIDLTRIYTAGEKTSDKWEDGFNNGLEKACYILQQVPTSTPWILCKNELPSKYTEVIVTTDSEEVKIAYLSEVQHEVCWYCDDEMSYYDLEWVVAWQPLPEPYKEK